MLAGGSRKRGRANNETSQREGEAERGESRAKKATRGSNGRKLECAKGFQRGREPSFPDCSSVSTNFAENFSRSKD